jgi:hypothetical protein
MDEILANDSITFVCKHTFHTECAKSLRDTRCPVCRASIESGSLTAEDLLTMESRGLEDKRERESALEYSSDDEYTDLIIPHYDNVMDIYADLINSYLSCEEYVEVKDFIVGIIGAITVIKVLLGLPDDMKEIGEELCKIVKDIYPEQDESETTYLVYKLIERETRRVNENLIT